MDVLGSQTAEQGGPQLPDYRMRQQNRHSPGKVARGSGSNKAESIWEHLSHQPEQPHGGIQSKMLLFNPGVSPSALSIL